MDCICLKNGKPVFSKPKPNAKGSTGAYFGQKRANSFFINFAYDFQFATDCSQNICLKFLLLLFLAVFSALLNNFIIVLSQLFQFQIMVYFLLPLLLAEILLFLKQFHFPLYLPLTP